MLRSSGATSTLSPREAEGIREAGASFLVRPAFLVSVSVCGKVRIPRSTVWAQRDGRDSVPLMKRGPKPLVTDSGLFITIREVLRDLSFMGEGYWEFHARVRNCGTHTDVELIRVLIRGQNLQAPGKPRRNHAQWTQRQDYDHDFRRVEGQSCGLLLL